MRISDWSSDVCSSDLYGVTTLGRLSDPEQFREIIVRANPDGSALRLKDVARIELGAQRYEFTATYNGRSEEHTSELQSLMRISYVVFCVKKKRNTLIS